MKNVMDKKQVYTNEMKWAIGFAIGFAVMGFGIFGYGVYLYNYSSSLDTLTELGEFLGGTAGSVWALSGLLFVYSSFLGQKEEIILQQEELRNNRKELKGQKKQLRLQKEAMIKQQFESTFFELLKIHRENVAQLELTVRILHINTSEHEQLFNGKAVFQVIYNHFMNIYETVYERLIDGTEGRIKKSIAIAYNILFYGGKSDLYVETLNDLVNDNTTTNRIIKYFKGSSYTSNQSNLGHYFRHLYQTVTYINSHKNFLNTNDGPYQYVKKLRAQLSDYELALLYLNSQSSLGQAWIDTENEDLITKFAMIKTLPSRFFNDYFDHRISFPNIQYEGNSTIFKESDEYKNINHDIISEYSY